MLLVKFLELFFPPEHLRERGRRYLGGPGDAEQADDGFALAFSIEDVGLRRASETHSLRAMLRGTGTGTEQDPHDSHTLASIQAARGRWPDDAALSFLEHGDEVFFQERWNEILELFAAMVRNGHAGQALQLVQSHLGQSARWTPLIAALTIAEQQDAQRLLAYSPEMRQAIELTLQRIAPQLLED